MGWPTSQLNLTSDLLDEFKAEFLKLCALNKDLTTTGLQFPQFQQPLHVVFKEVLVHFKYHFYTQKATNPNRQGQWLFSSIYLTMTNFYQPEWMLRYVLKISADHEVFLDLLQDMLNELPGNQRIAKAEYLSFLMEFLREKIQKQAFQLVSDSHLFSHLVTEVMRFDKAMEKLNSYDANTNDGNKAAGKLLEVFCEEPELFKFWLRIEFDAAHYRFSEIMKMDPYLPSASSTALVKHTLSSEKLIDLLAVITDRYLGLPSLYQVAFFEELQIRLLQEYLSEAKATLNKLQSNFIPNTTERAMEKKLDRLKAMMRVSGSLALISDVMNEWAEDLVFLEMLKYFKTSFYNDNSDSLRHSVFVGVLGEYSHVLAQIESIACEDCLQIIVESMWMFDQRNWSNSVESDNTISQEFRGTLNYIKIILDVFTECLPEKMCKGIHREFLKLLMERLLVRPIAKTSFTQSTAQQLELHVEAIIAMFPENIVQRTKMVQKMRETLYVLQLDRDQIVSLYHNLTDGSLDPVVTLKNLGIYRLSCE
ncbi:RINT-1/TIP-20 [Obelidium mucronatum]|nr:RINT-1/TIP-20 [Obelidium mucronatum]